MVHGGPTITSVHDIDAEPTPRVPLSRARVLRAAVEIADAEGVDGLTMRRIAAELDVEAMSLYHHVPNKESVLDGMVEMVIEEIVAAGAALTGPAAEDDWRGALRARLLAARAVQMRHKWAPAVIATRTGMSMAIVAWFDGLLGVLRAGGFSFDLAHHSLHALGSHALGFAQELFAPGSPEEEAEQEEEFDQMMEFFPNLAGMMAEIAHDGPDDTIGWCDDQTEFEFTIDVLIDGLERRRQLELAAD
ncbi:MAG: TetR family transcriptional regulator [Acidimicrobiales bacterium]|nr:MAG: TetR family transcriptional regulator [Acidimicrobiales bacterium]